MNKLYPLKHWLATLVIGPILPALYSLVIDKSIIDLKDLIQLYPLYLILGIFFSIPLLAIYYLCFAIMEKLTTSGLLVKTILTLLTVAGIYVTFKIIKGSMVPIEICAYSGAAIICSFIFKIKKVTHLDLENENKEA